MILFGLIMYVSTGNSSIWGASEETRVIAFAKTRYDVVFPLDAGPTSIKPCLHLIISYNWIIFSIKAGSVYKLPSLMTLLRSFCKDM